jgi:uncharacterized protein (UPF0335 family)
MATEIITGAIDREALQRYVGRVLRLHEERRTLNEDIASVYEEAKNAGFVTKIIRQIVREQQMEAEERSSHYALMDSYRHALGMLADLPLGAAAMARAGEETASRSAVEQPARRRGRPRKDGTDRVDEALRRSRAHLEGAEPAGAA